MVWPITVRESYVIEKGESMNAEAKPLSALCFERVYLPSGYQTEKQYTAFGFALLGWQ